MVAAITCGTAASVQALTFTSPAEAVGLPATSHNNGTYLVVTGTATGSNLIAKTDSTEANWHSVGFDANGSFVDTFVVPYNGSRNLIHLITYQIQLIALGPDYCAVYSFTYQVNPN